MTQSGHRGSLKKRGPPRAKYDQGFDGPAAVTEVSVNLKIDVQRVGLDLCKSGLGAAYWARVQWLEHEQCILQVLSPRPTFVQYGFACAGAERRSNLSKKE
jgi:hypothetical protein